MECVRLFRDLLGWLGRRLGFAGMVGMVGICQDGWDDGCCGQLHLSGGSGGVMCGAIGSVGSVGYWREVGAVLLEESLEFQAACSEVDEESIVEIESRQVVEALT